MERPAAQYGNLLYSNRLQLTHRRSRASMERGSMTHAAEATAMKGGEHRSRTIRRRTFHGTSLQEGLNINVLYLHRRGRRGGA